MPDRPRRCFRYRRQSKTVFFSPEDNGGPPPPPLRLPAPSARPKASHTAPSCSRHTVSSARCLKYTAYSLSLLFPAAAGARRLFPVRKKEPVIRLLFLMPGSVVPAGFSQYYRTAASGCQKDAHSPPPHHPADPDPDAQNSRWRGSPAPTSVSAACSAFSFGRVRTAISTRWPALNSGSCSIL